MVFAIAVELLAGRYTATQFNDRNRPEWPPHPARLYSAMVAAWADNDDPNPVERSALRWLEEQEPPAIRCGDAGLREVVTHYVPVNDATVLTRDVSNTYTTTMNARRTLREANESGDEQTVKRAQTALAKADSKAKTDAARAGLPTGRESHAVAAGVLRVLPEHRGKQGRTYPTVLPDETTVWFLWLHAEASEEHRNALDAMLSRVGRIGHSSTLVACRCVDSGPPPTLIPGRSGLGTRLRIPRTGLLDRLEQAFESHQGEEPRTLPAGMIDYHRPEAPRRTRRLPLLGGDWYVLGIAGRPASAIQALAIARATRNALLTHADQPPPEILSGHQHRAGKADGPTAPLDGPHLAVVPLPNAGNPYSDGTVLGIALILPADCADHDKRAVEEAIGTWSAAGLKLTLSARRGDPPIQLTLEDLGVDRASSEPAWLNTVLAARRKTTTRDYWCRSAHSWVTVTPIALDRFPGNLRSRESQVRDRAESEAAASIAQACVFAGLADLPEQVHVTIRLDTPLVGIPAAPGRRRAGQRQFPSYQTGTGIPRACVHAEIEFQESVQGPVLVGAGRYLGYGLCLPCEPRRNNP